MVLSASDGVIRITPADAGTRVVQAMGKAHPYADSLARYLEATGYIMWAVPESLHLDAITDDAIRIDAAAGPTK